MESGILSQKVSSASLGALSQGYWGTVEEGDRVGGGSLAGGPRLTVEPRWGVIGSLQEISLALVMCRRAGAGSRV